MYFFDHCQRFTAQGEQWFALILHTAQVKVFRKIWTCSHDRQWKVMSCRLADFLKARDDRMHAAGLHEVRVLLVLQHTNIVSQLLDGLCIFD